MFHQGVKPELDPVLLALYICTGKCKNQGAPGLVIFRSAEVYSPPTKHHEKPIKPHVSELDYEPEFASLLQPEAGPPAGTAGHHRIPACGCGCTLASADNTFAFSCCLLSRPEPPTTAKRSFPTGISPSYPPVTVMGITGYLPLLRAAFPPHPCHSGDRCDADTHRLRKGK